MPALFSLKRALKHQSGDYIDAYEDLYRQVIKNGDCISLKDLKVTGNDLMTEFHMKPGKEVGEKLKFLFNLVLDDPSMNDREQLLAVLHKEQE